MRQRLAIWIAYSIGVVVVITALLFAFIQQGN
jgi:uncharacterized membrane protein YidH (DUF202 family)